MTPLRIVFDTNVFTRKHFDLLEQSSMLQRCKRGQIIPVYGHVFLEEMFRAYGSESKRADLVQKWLPFVVNTVDRFCDDFISIEGSRGGIWHKELVQGKGCKTNIYMPVRDQEILLHQIINIPLDGTWHAWHESEKHRKIDEQKRAEQRRVSTGLRQEVADWKKAVKFKRKKPQEVKLDRFFESEVDNAGKQFLGSTVRCINHNAVADRWVRDKMNYPYFTMFVINMLYIAHHAMTRPNDGIDLNAQADLDLMTHLLHADLIVSNETGFLRQAFEDIWRPRGKVLLTTDQFVKLIG